MINNIKNPWSPNDEKEHFPSMMEWWCVEGFLKIDSDDYNWHYKSSFSQSIVNKEKLSSNYIFDNFDLRKNKHFRFHKDNLREKLNATNNLKISFENSFLKGKYPNYELNLKDPVNEILLDIKYNSRSLPHFIAQNITNGMLPNGLGYFKYGFIPNNKLFGKVKLKNKIFEADGIGYFEHVWGDFSYGGSIISPSVIKKTLNTYKKLGGWWIKNHKIKIPKSISFASENNPFGYDWIWAIFDNGWSLFLGNIMFFIKDGPLFGSLILTKDGNKYFEFSNAEIKYKKTAYLKEYDFFYPIKLEIKARMNNKILNLNFKMDEDLIVEHITKFINSGIKKGYALIEGCGDVNGFYKDEFDHIPLKGVCKMEPQRSLFKGGHNMIKLKFDFPPENIALSFNFKSHLLKKELFTKLSLVNKPRLVFKIKKVDIDAIEKNRSTRYIYPI